MTNILDQCQVCSKQGKVFRCSKCKVARYCSVECQKLDWKAGHRKTCRLSTNNNNNHQEARAHQALAELYSMTKGISVSEAKQRQDQAGDLVEKQKKQDLLQKTTIRFPKEENTEVANKSTPAIDRKKRNPEPSIKSEPESSSTKIKNVSFFLEEMKYIHQFQVSLRPQKYPLLHKEAYQMIVQPTPNGSSIVNFRSNDDTMEFSISLPRHIIPDQCSWNVYPEDGMIQLRLPFQESSSSLNHPELLVPLETLTPVEVINRIQCRQCHQALLLPKPIERTYFLPKGNWEEIADYLSCFGGPPVIDFASSTEVQPCTAAQDSNALCFHASDLDITVSVMAVSGYGESSSDLVVVVAPTIQPDSAVVRGNRMWQDAAGGGAAVCCTQCSSVLGFASLESPETFRLLKHRLSIGENNNDSGGKSSGNLELGSCTSFLAREMVRYAEAKAIFTFVIGMDTGAAAQLCQPVGSISSSNQLTPSTLPRTQQQLGKKCLLLRLVSWDTVVATETSSNNNDDGLKFEKVAKVVYEEVVDEIGKINDSNDSSQWVWGGVDLCCVLPGVKETAANGNNEQHGTISTVRLELPIDEYETVKQDLQSKSNLFPKSIKDATILMKMGAKANSNDMDLTVIPLS